MIDSFADTPQSIAEIRSSRMNDASLCMPRDILVETLREIDRGELDPELMIIAWQTKPNADGVARVHRRFAGPTTAFGFVGMLARIIHMSHTDQDIR